MKNYDLTNVDFALLKEQKALLVKTIWEDLDSELWGIVHFLDSVEDTWRA